jgi:HAD superfamily hydrolase (TIGR01484 family)
VNQATEVPTYAAIDLDGTILDSTGVASEGMERGLRSLSERGIRLIVATGRSPFSMDQLSLRSGVLSLFEPVMVLRDGDLVWDRRAQAAVHARFLPETIVPELTTTFEHVVCEYPNEIVATSHQAALHYALFYSFPRSAVRIDSCPAAKEALKAVTFHAFRKHPPPALNLDGTSYRLSETSDRLVVTPDGSCKAAGLHYVLSRFYGQQGFAPVMAIGDGPNDECLLGVVQHGIAVANAESATAARASCQLHVPLEDFLAGFDGRMVRAGRPLAQCPHLVHWAYPNPTGPPFAGHRA